MKKLTALLLAAVMLLSLAACAGAPEQTNPTTASAVTEPSTEPETEPVTQPVTEPVTEPATEPSTEPPAHALFDSEACASLFGTWSTTVTMDKELLNTSYFNKKVTFALYYTFREDGTFAVHVDEEAFHTAITEFEGLLVEHMVERGYATFKAEMERDGYSQTRIETMWAEEEEARQRTEAENFMAGLNLLGRFSKLLREGQYYVEDGRVCTELADGTFESSAFTVKNAKLTLKDTDNLGLYRTLCINFPLVLTAAS